MKKAQASIEYIMIFTFLVIVFAVVMKIGLEHASDAREQTEFLMLKDVVTGVKIEILTAFDVEDGYSRNFTTPEHLFTEDYNITISNSTLIAESSRHKYTLSIPPATGTVRNGENQIGKYDGQVQIN